LFRLPVFLLLIPYIECRRLILSWTSACSF